jgi:hypothetical protein
MESGCKNAKVFKWANNCIETMHSCKNLNVRVHSQIIDANMDMLTIDECSTWDIIRAVSESVRHGGNKLRTYKRF